MVPLLVLAQFTQSYEKHDNSEKALRKLKKEFTRLKIANEENYLYKYLTNQQAIPLQGHAHQYKYRFSGGERIFFTLGMYVNGLVEKLGQEYSTAMVIYSFSEHDDQDRQFIPDFHNAETIEQRIGELSQAEIQEVSEELNKTLQIQSFDEMCNIFPEWTQNHSVFVFSGDNISNSLDEADVMMSPEQSNIVTKFPVNNSPLLLLGGAGTGKTIMALHILGNYITANNESKCIYFTQSDALRSKAQTKFQYIVNTDLNYQSIVKNVEFKNINRFCIEYYNKNNSNKLSLEDEFTSNNFYSYADRELQNDLKKLNINSYDLWAEIRGTIKGGLTAEWQRPHIFNINNFNQSFIKQIKDFIEFDVTDQRLFKIKNFQKLNNFIVLNQDGSIKKFINQIIDNLNEVDPSIRLIPKDFYLKQIKAENTTLPKEHRDEYYRLTERYQSFLDSTKKLDDNDLILKMLSCPIHTEDKYDFIVIDEIQDYTELQIYAILTFAKNKNCIVMAGDNHQIINPTIFSIQRIRDFFNHRGIDLDVKAAYQNFRCPTQIVNMGNRLTELSNTYIAAQNQQDRERARFSTTDPFFVPYTTPNIRQIITNLLPFPKAVILVSTESKKNELINLYGSEEYNKANNPLINTVAEIKGMEYDYVVLIDIVSTYEEEWSQIFNNLARQQTKFRYYFNLFYVAITRTQKYLCFLESNKKNQLYDELTKSENVNIKQVENVDIDLLKINELDNQPETWLDAAEKHLKEQNFEKAEQCLTHVPDSFERKKNLSDTCNLKKAFQNHDFENTLKYALLLNDNSLEQYYLDSQNSSIELTEDLKELIQYYLRPNNFYNNMNKISNKIKKVFSNENDKNKVIMHFINKLTDYITNTALDDNTYKGEKNYE